MASCLAPAIEAAEARLRPAPAAALRPQVKDLLAFAAAFGIRLEAAAVTVATRAYAQALAHLPADLLAEAFRRVRDSHRWGNRLPLPAEVAATVREELARRRLVALRLRTAQAAPIEPEWRDGPRTPEDIAAVEAAVAAVKGGPAAPPAEAGVPALPGSDVVPPEGLSGEALAAWWRARMDGGGAPEEAAA